MPSAMKMLGALCAIGLVACAAMATEADRLLADKRIGPVTLGMTASSIEKLGFPSILSQVALEGDVFHQIKVTVGRGAEITATLDSEGKAFELLTRSPRFSASNGARVGMSLNELRKLFPNGKVSRGFADRLYFVFLTQDGGGTFSFDANTIGEDCVLPERTCGRSLDDQKSVEYIVRE